MIVYVTVPDAAGLLFTKLSVILVIPAPPPLVLPVISALLTTDVHVNVLGVVADKAMLVVPPLHSDGDAAVAVITGIGFTVITTVVTD